MGYLTTACDAIFLQGVAWLTLAMETPKGVHTPLVTLRAAQQALVDVFTSPVVPTAEEEPLPARALVPPFLVDAVLATPTIRV